MILSQDFQSAFPHFILTHAEDFQYGFLSLMSPPDNKRDVRFHNGSTDKEIIPIENPIYGCDLSKMYKCGSSNFSAVFQQIGCFPLNNLKQNIEIVVF